MLHTCYSYSVRIFNFVTHHTHCVAVTEAQLRDLSCITLLQIHSNDALDPTLPFSVKFGDEYI